MSLDILLLGNVTRDIAGDDPDDLEYTLGGSVSYAALTCRQLKVRPELATRAAANVDMSELQAAARCTVLHSETTTTFANRYSPEGRIQYCYHPAPPITAADLTPRMRQAKVVFMCPIMQEVAADVPACFSKDSFLAAGPQGWLRRIDAEGRVHVADWAHQDAFLRRLNVLILSREDIGFDLERLFALMEHVPLAVLSNYKEGCDVFRRNNGCIQKQHVPPRPAAESDPTGAGDIFAAAFLVRYLETGHVWHSARFANVMASFGVEGIGASTIPSRQTVMEYLYRYPVAEPGL